MGKWKNQKHTSFLKSIPKRSMFLKMQKIFQRAIKNLDGNKKFFLKLKKVTFEISGHLKKVNNFKLLCNFLSAWAILSPKSDTQETEQKKIKKNNKNVTFLKIQKSCVLFVMWVARVCCSMNPSKMHWKSLELNI